jgi:hypothetical protein
VRDDAPDAMSRRILVTGCARSGTGYCAALLSRVGIACGHEALFTPVAQPAEQDGWPSGVEAESSWLAAPFLAQLPRGTLVVHVVRDPAATLRSLWRIGLFRTRSIYRAFAERHCAPLNHGEPIERTAKYWLRWNELVESAQLERGLRYVRVRLEELDEQTVRHIGELAEREIDLASARRALAEISRHTNTAGERAKDTGVDWSALARTELSRALEQLASRYGFEPHSSRALLTRAA